MLGNPSWPLDWQPIDGASAAGLHDELKKELARGHLLHGVAARVIARREAADDVLLALEDGSGRVAEVHLTWKGGKERPPWPQTLLFDSLVAWAVAAERE